MRIAFIAAVMSLLMLTTATASTKSTVKNITGSNTYVTKEFMFSSFENIQASGNLAIEFIQDGDFSVKLYTSDNLAELVQVTVEDGTLKANIRKGYNIKEAEHLTLYVSAPSIGDINISGAVSLAFKGQLNQPRLNVTASGAARIESDGTHFQDARINVSGAASVSMKELICERFAIDGSGACNIKITEAKLNAADFELSGAGTMSLKGNCQKAIYNISGAGNINAEEMIADDVMASCSGISSIYCHADNAIKANATGLSKILYTGSPTAISISKGVTHK